MPWDALPEHLNTPEKWAGTDWDNKAQRWLLKFKGWFAYGPRSKHKWAAWKSPPRMIFGLGVSRWEHLTANELYLPMRKIDTRKNTATLREDGYFPSVVQYWSRGHLLITWPFHVSFHWFWPWAQPAYYPTRTDYTIKQMFSFRIGARYDKDDVYWFPSAAVGGDFV